MAAEPGITVKRAKKPAVAQPDNPPAGSRRKQLMENEILEQATRLFAERGFNGTSLQDVADATGLKRSALYYYFKSKDELLDRLIVEATIGPARDLTEIAARSSLNAAARLHAMARHIVVWTIGNRDRFLLLVKSESDLSPASAKKFSEGRRVALDAVRSVIEEGIAAGQFRPTDPQVAAFGVWSICNWPAWWYQPGGRMPLDAVADQLAEMVVAGLQRVERRESGVVSSRSALAALREQIDELEQALARDDASLPTSLPRRGLPAAPRRRPLPRSPGCSSKQKAARLPPGTSSSARSSTSTWTSPTSPNLPSPPTAATRTPAAARTPPAAPWPGRPAAKNPVTPSGSPPGKPRPRAGKSSHSRRYTRR